MRMARSRCPRKRRWYRRMRTSCLRVCSNCRLSIVLARSNPSSFSLRRRTLRLASSSLCAAVSALSRCQGAAGFPSMSPSNVAARKTSAGEGISSALQEEPNSPCLRAFCAERALPAALVGPLLFAPLRRLASAAACDWDLVFLVTARCRKTKKDRSPQSYRHLQGVPCRNEGRSDPLHFPDRSTYW